MHQELQAALVDLKALRTRWRDHLGSTTGRSVLLCDEAQEMSPLVNNELRLLCSARFDSQSLLCMVLAGAARLQEKIRREELIPLGSRIRTRLAAEAAPAMNYSPASSTSSPPPATPAS